MLAEYLRLNQREVTELVLSEYDEQQHIENEKMWSREEGRNEHLLELINKKLAKGKPVSIIAEELEEEEETILRLIAEQQQRKHELQYEKIR